MHRENLSVGSIAGKAEVYLGLVTVPCLAALVVRGTFSQPVVPGPSRALCLTLRWGDDSPIHPLCPLHPHRHTPIFAFISQLGFFHHHLLLQKSNHSYRTGVKHNSNASTEGFGRQVVVEFCSDDTAISVRSCHFAPDHADFAALSFTRGLVDECDTLAEVEPVIGRGG